MCVCVCVCVCTRVPECVLHLCVCVWLVCLNSVSSEHWDFHACTCLCMIYVCTQKPSMFVCVSLKCVYSQVAQSIALASVFMSFRWIISIHARECWDYTPLLVHVSPSFSLSLSHFLLSSSLSPLSLLSLLAAFSSTLLIVWIMPILVVQRD